MEERSCGEGEELVMGSDEEGSKIIPSRLGIHGLEEISQGD